MNKIISILSLLASICGILAFMCDYIIPSFNDEKNTDDYEVTTDKNTDNVVDIDVSNVNRLKILVPTNEKCFILYKILFSNAMLRI